MATTCGRPSPFRIAVAALLAVSGVHGVPVSEKAAVRPRDEMPNMPHDPNTEPACGWWWDNDGHYACKDVAKEFQICPQDFLRWNPSITPDCGNYLVGWSYCVEGPSDLVFPECGEPPAGNPSGTTTTGAAATSTGPSNGIKTPDVIQPGMVPNCNKFYFVKQGDTCASIAQQHGISMEKVQEWNPSVGDTCSLLQANSNACVGVIGFQPSATSTTSKATSTTAAPGNGIETPSPIQPNMTKNCNKWHFVGETTTCKGIVEYDKISMADFVKWNPAVGANCDNLWLNTWACVGVVGGSTTKTTTTKAATTTSSGNGISTPTAIQPGMVSNCNKFHPVKETTTCKGIVEYNKISMADFIKWNPSVGPNCDNLWLGTSACVGVIGGNPPASTTTKQPAATATKGSNGIETPLPTQSGMASNCNKFHYIRDTTPCSGVLTYNDITMAEFFKWNPSVKSDCSGMLAGTNACVNVVGRDPNKPTTTKQPAPTATKGPNGIETPLPTQSGMVSNCNKFHYIRDTTKCSGVLTYNDISMAEFFKWNPAVKSDCSTLQVGTNACVNVVGRDPNKPTTTKQPAPTATKGSNGIETPLPTQSGMASNCNKFHYIRDTTKCSGVLTYNDISMAEFFKWNPAVKSDCSAMQVGTNACVNVVGRNPKPTTTKSGNGVPTPTPIQPGMVKGCTKFHPVKKTTTCQGILDYNKITKAQFVKWNPAVKSDCSNLWADTWACVAGP